MAIEQGKTVDPTLFEVVRDKFLQRERSFGLNERDFDALLWWAYCASNARKYSQPGNLMEDADESILAANDFWNNVGGLS